MDTSVLLIAVSSQDTRLALAEALRERYRVHACADGRAALDLLRQHKPSILVLDLMLPELDGLTILRRAHAEGIRPKALILTDLVSPYVRDAAVELGFDYIMLMPCDIRAVVKNIEAIACPISAAKAADLMKQLGISDKLMGFQCIPIAAAMLAGRKQPLTKELYPELAKKLGPGSTKDHVEHWIRYAITEAWKHRDDAVWAQYFPKNKNGEIPRPTNLEFLKMMIRELTTGSDTE